jgi:hypothetical protein
MSKLVRIIASRWFNFTILPIMILVWFFWTDPSNGADTMLRIQLWAQALLVIGLSYLISKAMLGKASSEYLYTEAVNNNLAAGVAYVGVCLLRSIILFSMLSFFSQVQR